MKHIIIALLITAGVFGQKTTHWKYYDEVDLFSEAPRNTAYAQGTLYEPGFVAGANRFSNFNLVYFTRQESLAFEISNMFINSNNQEKEVYDVYVKTSNQDEHVTFLGVRDMNSDVLRLDTKINQSNRDKVSDIIDNIKGARSLYAKVIWKSGESLLFRYPVKNFMHCMKEIMK